MSYDELVEQFGEPENIYYQYIDDNDLYQPVQKHKRSYKKIFITVLVLMLIAFVVEFISIAYEARKSFIDREVVEITYDDQSIYKGKSIKGRFTYNGNSATCIDSDIETTYPSPLWKITNKSASKSLKKTIASAIEKNI